MPTSSKKTSTKTNKEDPLLASLLGDSEAPHDQNYSPAFWAKTVVGYSTKIRGWRRCDVADALQISTSYLNSLLSNSTAQPKFVGMDKVRISAQIMNIPTLSALLMTGQITTEDLMLTTTIEDSISNLYDQMRTDLMYGPYAPTAEEWEKLSVRSKCGILLLYQDAQINKKKEVLRALIDHASTIQEQTADQELPLDERF